MSDPATLTIALPRAAVWIRDAIRADRANAYGLDAPWTLPKLGGDLKRLDLMPPDYSGPAFHIAGGVITELPFAADPRECDGCTLAPDWWPKSWGGIRAYVGAIFHDRWYRAMEDMARAWGWEVSRVRKLGDVVFANILRSLAKTLHGWQRVKAEVACRVYYRSVRAFGGVGHAAYKRFEGSKVSGSKVSGSKVPGSKVLALALAGSLALGGCAGCAVPLAWDDPDAEVQIPAHSYSNLVTGASWSYPIPAASGSGAAETAPAGASETAGTSEGGQ